MDRNPSLQAYWALVIGVAAVALAAIFIRLAHSEGIPSLVIAAGRLLVATLLLTPAALRSPVFRQQMRTLSQPDLILAAISGMLLAMHFASWVTSLEYTTVLISGVLVTTTPIWVALLEVLILRTRLSPLVIAGLVVALIGGIFVTLGGGGNGVSSNLLLGGGLALIGALGVAGYLIIGRKLRSQLSLTPYIWLVYGCASLALLVVIALNGTPVTGYSSEGYLWIVAMGLVPQLIGHSSLNFALAFLPATYVSISTQMEPVLAAVAAYFIFTEVPGSAQIIGGTVIMIGVFLATIGQSRQKRVQASVIKTGEPA